MSERCDLLSCARKAFHSAIKTKVLNMVDITDLIKALLKSKQVNTDNHVFRLHYKFTVILLLLFSLLVTSKQYFGEPISCESGSKDKYSLDTYCWIYSTFSVKQHFKGALGKSIIAPGVGPSSAIMAANDSNDIIAHKYYQWVSIVLFFQAVFFYIPRYMWKIWEAGRLKLLVKEFGSPISDGLTKEYKHFLVKYLTQNSYIHNIYGVRYVICEIFNLINVVLQIILMNWFLSGHFTDFGIAVATFTLNETAQNANPMSYIFPKLAKCTYANFGPSGSIQYIDALCILPLNIINEKIYVLLWFWFMFLAALTLLALLYRMLVICSKTIRVYLLMAHVRNLDKTTAKLIIKNLTFGDWFILYQMGKNMNPALFQEVITDLPCAFTTKKSNNII